METVPPTVLSQVADCLSLADAWSFLNTCSYTWNARQEIGSKRTIVKVEHSPRGIVLLQKQPLLCALNLGAIASDKLLMALDSWSIRFPCLRELNISRSNVSNIRILHDHPSLSYVDITYCNRISYSNAVALKASLSKGSVVRRIPTWMTGRIETGFENDNIHTYWPDGTFNYERGGDLSMGFVSEATEAPDGHVLIYFTFCVLDELFVPSLSISLSPVPSQKDGTKQIIVALALPPRTFIQDLSTSVSWPTIDQASLSPGIPVTDDQGIRVTKMNVLALTDLEPPEPVLDAIDVLLRQGDISS